MIEPAIREKLLDLERRSRILTTEGRDRDTQHVAECQGWITEALNVVELAVPIADNQYRKRVKMIGEGGGISVSKVASLGAILRGLLRDISAGLIADFGNRIRAETFDDFLEHADAYREEGKKQAAGVLAGVVFEDTIRRICRDKNIIEKDRELDQLINALAAGALITGQQARQARTAAFVRTKATHAQWDEYELDGVAQTITLTRQLLEKHLSG